MTFTMTDEPRNASLQAVNDASSKVRVHFYPTSLEYNASNTVREQGTGETKQYVTESSAKLTVDLIFDTTLTGKDVRSDTGKIINLMKPIMVGKQETTPPVVIFEWGAYSFKGLIETYKETITFFHASGVPLRSTVNLVLAAQEKVFETGTGTKDAAIPDPAEVPGTRGQNATSLATQAGNSRAGGRVAAANGQETMRFTKGPLTVSSTIQTRGPVTFATGAGTGAGIGGSAGVGGGAGLSGGAGISGGISGGASIGARASAGLSGSISGSARPVVTTLNATFGSRQSAGVSLSQGAFNGLGVSASAGASFSLQPQNLLSNTGGAAGISLTGGASVNAAGQAGAGGTVKVELNANGKGARIIFE